jgi:hypothetical protein
LDKFWTSFGHIKAVQNLSKTCPKPRIFPTLLTSIYSIFPHTSLKLSQVEFNFLRALLLLIQTMTTKTIKDLLKSYQVLVKDITMQQDIYNFYIFLALRKQLTFRRNEVVQINAIFSNSYDGSIFFF